MTKSFFNASVGLLVMAAGMLAQASDLSELQWLGSQYEAGESAYCKALYQTYPQTWWDECGGGRASSQDRIYVCCENGYKPRPGQVCYPHFCK